MFTYTSTAPEATEAFGRALAHLLRPGDVLALRGELGAGKTALVRGIAAGLGVPPGAVSSPTFVVVNQYAAPGPISSLTHVDAYRVHSIEELENLGWDRLFDAAGRALGNTVAVIEWPERLAGALTPDAASIDLAHTGEEERDITAAFPQAWRSRPDFDLLVGRRPALCPVTRKWVAQTAATYPFADARARDADLYKWIVPAPDADDTADDTAE